uniref:RNase H type-1 domain-containing protein n=1 Tax=Cannabis sativa TaxID=3483 RepID=A0A803Q8K4_CANSA
MPDSCISQTTSIFQAHPIKVLTDRLLRQVLSIPDASGRLIKWSIELGQFDITYNPRTSIKGQALVDFLIEGKISKEDPLVKNDTETWKLYVDEASNENGSGAGLIMMSPDNFKFHYTLRFQLDTSNNEAEYEALLASLRIAEALKVKNLICYSDSQLIVNQVLGEYQEKGLKMEKYLEKLRKNLEKFNYFKIEPIPREHNSNADALAKLASQNELDKLNLVSVKVLNDLNICENEEVDIIDALPTWMTPILKYLIGRELQTDKTRHANSCIQYLAIQ